METDPEQKRIGTGLTGLIEGTELLMKYETIKDVFKAVGVTPNAIALAEQGERGISEPLARLVKMLVQVHTGELVQKRRSSKKDSR